MKDLVDMNRGYQEKKDELMNELREEVEEFKKRVSTERAVLQGTVVMATAEMNEAQIDMAKREDKFMQGALVLSNMSSLAGLVTDPVLAWLVDINVLMKEATDKITAEMDTLQMALTSALAVIEKVSEDARPKVSIIYRC